MFADRNMTVSPCADNILKKIVFGNGLLDGLISNDSFRAVHNGHSQDGAQRKKPVAIFIERKSEFDT